MVSLLQTKLHCPPPLPQSVKRPFLNQQLQEGLDLGRQVTLVSAPAGFGKTSCITAWIQTITHPVTWLALDSSDDEPGRFFTYLIAALQKIDRRLGQEIEGILRAGQLPPTEIISATLINDILTVSNPFLLVLDDFQLIQDKAVLQVMQTLVANLPPPLHLVLLTREEPSLPLARLRANNQLTEIRAADLRFTEQETAVFLHDRMGLSLTQSDLTLLAEKTEGWIVGLQLAALSLRNRANPTTFIANLSGSHRHILSYLTEEVLNQQAAEIQTFLLQTSILEQLHGELCDAITGKQNGRILLEQLYNDNLFLIPLDDEQKWYRFHPLFADLLRTQQQNQHPQEMAEQHRRASQWFQSAGMSNEAIQHALADKDYETAVSLIEEHAMDMLMQWHAKTVREWMQSIPPEWANKSPKTNLAFAWMHLFSGNFVEAHPYIERLQNMFANAQFEAKNPAIKAEWMALQTMLLNGQGQSEAALALANQALTIVPAAEAYVRSLLYSALATAYQQMDEYAQAVAAYQELIQLGKTTHSLVAELMGISALGLYAIERGQLRFAFEVAAQGIKRVEQSGTMSPISSAVYGELGSIYYQWHQLEKAHAYFQKATQVSTLSGYSDAELYHHVVHSRLAQIEGDLETAVHEIETAVHLMQTDAPAAVREEIIAQQIRILLAQNQVEAAEDVLKTDGFTFRPKLSIPDLTPNQVLNRLYSSALRILIARGQTHPNNSKLQAGINLTDNLIAIAKKRKLTPFVIELSLIRAQLYALLNNEQASTIDILVALKLGEPEGFITIFLEEGESIMQTIAHLLHQNQIGDVHPETIKKIIAAYPSPLSTSKKIATENKATNQPLIDPLSKRELEILQLIGEGHSNQDIAKQLVITLHTVKKHSSNIYAKLGVNSRTQAVAKAHQLDLL